MSDLHPTPEPPVPAPPATDQVVVPASAPVIEERMHPLSPLVSLWLGVVALGWFAVTSFLQGDPIWEDFDRLGEWLTSVPWWVFIAAGGVLIGLGFGYWGWWTTKFVIDDREFRLENTGAFQESQRIAFSRIQSVDVTQPFAARLLGLAEVKIDVGAEGGASLKYLRRARATEVRDYLMTRAHGRAVSTAEPGRTAVKVRFGAGYRAFEPQDAPYIELGESALVGSGVGALGQDDLAVLIERRLKAARIRHRQRAETSELVAQVRDDANKAVMDYVFEETPE